MKSKIFLALSILTLALLPSILSGTNYEYFSNIIARIFIFSLFAMSLNLLVGHSGLVSMCHALFYGMGGYVVAIFAYEQFLFNQFILILVAALVLVSLLAYLVGFLSLKTGGIYFIMITLAFGQLGFFFFVGLDRYGGEDGLIISNQLFLFAHSITPLTVYYLSLIALLSCYYLSKRIVNSHFGVALNAIYQNPSRMLAFGFNNQQYQLIMFIYAALLAILAGCLSALLDGFISPWELHWTKSADALIMIIIGGFKYLAGPILGAIFYVLFQEIVSPITHYWKLYLGLVLMLVLFLPNGFLSLLLKFRKNE